MKGNIDPNKIPRHIAVIMDGNGRWAKKQGMANRVFGHRNAIKAVREITEGCAELGVEYLTLYTFSSENWDRPAMEVTAIMQLLISTIEKEAPKLAKNNVRLQTIGDIEKLPKKCQEQLEQAKKTTSGCTGLTLNLALSYGGRGEILRSVRSIAQKVAKGEINPDEIDEKVLADGLYTAGMPDPDLFIRTSGEMRVSNFLLWQIAYTELYITDILWPDFRKTDLHQAIEDYQSRERRFGKTSEQVQE
ncbi:isoprenyl transferase [Fulvitalea axinellae]|uniref:Isoprenyl transferase n=1 Tax=Fulvitalea axinellae TaxID=1182444 RepID=A0AAU9CX84_9BACT|nr:isoprenyl transferase [Fulvitalea axinellae]